MVLDYFKSDIHLHATKVLLISVIWLQLALGHSFLGFSSTADELARRYVLLQSFSVFCGLLPVVLTRFFWT